VFDSKEAKNGMCPYGLLEVNVVCKDGITSFDEVHVDYLKRDPQSNELKLNEKHLYYYQVQCQLGLTGIEWCDVFSYLNYDNYFCQRIRFNSFFSRKQR
jgi:hypothetical protein